MKLTTANVQFPFMVGARLSGNDFWLHPFSMVFSTV